MESKLNRIHVPYLHKIQHAESIATPFLRIMSGWSRWALDTALTDSLDEIESQSNLVGVRGISVATERGGGAGGAIAPPPPIMPFRTFVGTFGNLSVHLSRQACHLYRQSI